MQKVKFNFDLKRFHQDSLLNKVVNI